MIVWALFDSGNGCYTKVANKFPEIKIYPIGMDIERKNEHFIKLNLADYARLFGDDLLFDTLDKLPKPDIIIASPPCESWSVASAMKGGNACWKQETGDSLFEPQIPLSRFTIRNRKDYEGVQFKFDSSILKRINGELCTYNTIEIIKRYNPKVFIIENPATSRMWEYIEQVLGFNIPFENLTNYGNYGYIIKKPTKFKSNIELNLLYENIHFGYSMSEVIKGYNKRSNIPHNLIEQIYNEASEYLKKVGDT